MVELVAGCVGRDRCVREKGGGFARGYSRHRWCWIVPVLSRDACGDAVVVGAMGRCDAGGSGETKRLPVRFWSACLFLRMVILGSMQQMFCSTFVLDGCNVGQRASLFTCIPLSESGKWCGMCTNDGKKSSRRGNIHWRLKYRCSLEGRELTWAQIKS